MARKKKEIIKEPDPVGRPSKFTPERRAAILKSIGNRVPYELAALANGIGEETLYGWIRQGVKDSEAGIDSEFAEFSESLKQIEEKKIVELLEDVAGKPERWQAAAWILERRWWRYFSTNPAIIEFNARLDKMERDAGMKKEGDTLNGHSEIEN